MDHLPLSKLIHGLDTDIRGIERDVVVTYIGHDSRDIPADGVPMFFAIRGQHVDGNMFNDAVMHKNGRTIIISEDPTLRHGIVVKDLSLCMAVIARRFYHAPDKRLNMVAVTGTNGKTTIGYLVRALLNIRSKTGMLGTIIYDLGKETVKAINTTPLATEFFYFLAKCRENRCRSVVFEASSHAIDQNRIFGLSIDVAIFTNLTQEHLDYHKTMEQYFSAKLKLFDGRNGQVPRYSVVNIDDPYGARMAEKLRSSGQTVLSFGEKIGADFQIVEVEDSLNGASFGLRHDGMIEFFDTQLFGRHNISNIAAGICAAYCLGYTMNDARAVLSDFTGVPGRLDRVSLKNGARVFIDYAHTPDALQTVLNALHPYKTGRLITVFGCGGDRDRTKRAPMTSIACELSDHAIATADNPRTEPIEQIFDDMRRGIHPESSIEFIPDRRLAIASAVHSARPDDIVLIAGRGHEDVQIIGDDLVHFNDKELVEELDA